MEPAEISTMDDTEVVVPQFASTRNHGVIKNELIDLVDIEEEEGERKRLIDNIIQSSGKGFWLQPMHKSPQPQLDPSMVPLAGVATSFAPSPIFMQPSRLQMHDLSRASLPHGQFIGLTPDKEEEENDKPLVLCHRCGARMRDCVRKMRYVDHIKEYPAYRCTRKGCQTFKSVRIVEQPELARAPRGTRTAVDHSELRELQEQPEQPPGELAMQPMPQPRVALDVSLPNPYAALPNPYAALPNPYASSARRRERTPPPPPQLLPRPPVLQLQQEKMTPLQLALSLPPAPKPPIGHDNKEGVLSAARNLLLGMQMDSKMEGGGGGCDFGLPPPSTPPEVTSSMLMMTPLRTPMSSILAPLLPTPAVRQPDEQPLTRKRSRDETQEQRDSVMALLRRYEEEMERGCGEGELPPLLPLPDEQTHQRHPKRVCKVEESRATEPEEPKAELDLGLITPLTATSSTSFTSMSLPPLNSSYGLFSPFVPTLSPLFAPLPSPDLFRSSFPSLFPPSSTMTSLFNQQPSNPLFFGMGMHQSLQPMQQWQPQMKTPLSSSGQLEQQDGRQPKLWNFTVKEEKKEWTESSSRENMIANGGEAYGEARIEYNESEVADQARGEDMQSAVHDEYIDVEYDDEYAIQLYLQSL